MTDFDYDAWFAKVAADEPPAEDGVTPIRPTRPQLAAGASWRAVNLDPILNGTRARPQPTILRRTDKQGLIYPGLTHTIVGESEAAKSWVAQYGCSQLLVEGHNVVYLDFEDSADSVVGDRMTVLGMPPQLLRDSFGYIAPEEPIEPNGRDQLAQAIGDLHPALIILDGVTEAMALHSLKTNDPDDFATFGRMITRPLTAGGAAVITLDHQPKNSENRGRYALGTVHKLNVLTGVSLIAESVAPFGVGLRGITRLRIAKDRPGQLRAHGLHAEGGLRWIGDFILDTRDQAEPAFIQPPVEVKKAADEWRPTEVMVRICEAMEKAKEPLTKNGIYDRVKGKSEIIRRALAVLVDEEYVTVEQGKNRAQIHTLVRPFRGDDVQGELEPDEPEW